MQKKTGDRWTKEHDEANSSLWPFFFFAKAPQNTLKTHIYYTS